jgi:Ca2+/H+ antiporter
VKAVLSVLSFVFCAALFVFQCPQASYHLFHAHLDLRWYHLTILHQLVKCQSLYITLDDSQQNSEEHKRVDRNVLEEHILLLLSDLIVIAISKFERVRVCCHNYCRWEVSSVD